MSINRTEILRFPEVCRRTGLARSTIYRDMARGDFPRNFKIGSSTSVGWLSSQIDQWLDDRAAKAGYDVGMEGAK